METYIIHRNDRIYMVETRDGTYKTRNGSHGERLIQIRAGSDVEYVRYVDENTGIIRLIPNLI